MKRNKSLLIYTLAERYLHTDMAFDKYTRLVGKYRQLEGVVGPLTKEQVEELLILDEVEV